MNDHPSFVGRDVLLRALHEAVTRHRIFVLMGAPKTGRTSVLRKIVDKANEALRAPTQTAKHVVVCVDLQALAAPNPQQLVQLIWNALQNAVLDPYVQSHGDPPRPVKLTLLRTDDPWQVFRTACDTLWGQLANTAGWCRYTLLFDNADVLAAPGWGSAVQALAEMVSRDQGARPQALGFAGSLGMRALLAPQRKAMRAARLHLLEPLRQNDVMALGALADLDPQAVDMCYQAVGGHPYLVQQLFAALEAQPDADPNAVGEALAPQLADYFSVAFAALPPPNRGTHVSQERAVMAWLLEQGGEGDAFQAEQALGLGPVRAACDHVVAMGFMERSVRGLSGTWLRMNAAMFNAWAKDALHM